MQSLSQEYAEILEVMHFKNNGRTKYEEALTGFIDFEWFQFGGHNVLISVQIMCVSLESTTNRIYYTKIGERLKKGLSIEGHLSSDAETLKERWKLEEIVEQTMLQHDGGKLKKRKSGRTRVILVAHNTVAEWSMFADRDEDRIVKRLTSIRKSPVTGNHPIKLHNRQIGKVDLEIFDTRLLLPAGLQSLDKASSLLGDEFKKIEVSEFYKRNMHELLRDHPALFERYALRDTEVTAKLFFMLQKQLNLLAFKRIDHLFKTLASAGVQGFLEKKEWFPEYREALLEEPFAEVIPIIKRAYLGGLNMGCFRGNTDDFKLTRGYSYADLDFGGAYTNGMARCAKIDVNGEVDIVRAEYRWSNAIEKILVDENLPPALIAKAKTAVNEGREAVEELLRDLREVKKSKVNGKRRRWKLLQKELHKLKTQSNKKHAEILAWTLFVPNNRHLDRWVELTDQGLDYELPGFAKVRFISPVNMVYPCLPTKKLPYGLCYVLEGETLLPAVELVQAVKAGVKVEVLYSLELPVEKDATGQPDLYFYDHLKYLVSLRAEAKKLADNSPEHEAKQQILKEFVNGFYGKTAQGLNYRRMFNPSTGEFFPLTPSEITEPSVAALVTGQVRAALAGTLLAVESYNKKRPGERPIVVISATTDGLLIGLPSEPGYSVTDEYYDIPSPDELAQGVPPKMKKVDTRALLKRFGHEALLDEFYSYPTIQNLRGMRQKLTGKDDFFEVKHLADRVESIKTRGQVGMIKYGNREYCSLIARYGHKVPLSLIYEPEVYSAIMKGDRNTADAKWLFERIDNALSEADVEYYPFLNLTSFKKILESKGKVDLTNQVQMKRTNSDWDFKRRFVRNENGDLSPFSLPHKNLAALLRERRQADAIRKGGQCATPELVEQRLKVKGRGVRARSGHAALLTRQFLRALLQGHFGDMS